MATAVWEEQVTCFRKRWSVDSATAPAEQSKQEILATTELGRTDLIWL